MVTLIPLFGLAYYSGARSGKILSLSRDCFSEDSLIIRGKPGRRMAKLNDQAKV
jgi:integrase